MDATRRCRAFIALVLGAFAGSAAGAEGVFVLGQPAPLTGVQAVTGKSTHEGMRLYADWINRNGGVHGRRIQLVVRDDAHQPAQTVKVVRELIEQDNAILLVGGTGTANIEMPSASKAVFHRTPGFSPCVALRCALAMTRSGSDAASLRSALIIGASAGVRHGEPLRLRPLTCRKSTPRCEVESCRTRTFCGAG